MNEHERLIDFIVTAENEVFRAFPYTNSTKRIEMVADYLLENGVIVPPVKVETTVYYTDSYRHLIKPLEIIGFEVDYTKRICKYYCRGGDYTPAWFKPAEIGKIAFLTREEAEKALEGSENNEQSCFNQH